MRLHLLSLPHTVTHPRFSHCAITSKVLRFPPMLQSVGYDVIHYGVEGAASGASEQVDVLTEAEWLHLGGREPSSRHVNDLCDVRTRLYQTFNAALVPLLRERLQPQDLICLPFGIAHDAAMEHFPNVQQVETGIGYPWPRARAPHRFRVYESNAWMHYCLGHEGAGGNDYDHVIPNSYDPAAWQLGDGDVGYLLYFGRIMQDKGLDIILEIAKARPDLRVILCGLGDPSPWLTLPNIEYRPPLHGEGRDTLLGQALAVLMPTRYVECFGSVGVEAMFCGTPVLGSAFGAFTETIQHGCNGYRCRTLQDWLDGIAAIEEAAPMHRASCWGTGLSHLLQWSRPRIRAEAARHYSMWSVAHQYDAAFRQISELWNAGWYARRTVEAVA